MEPSKKNIAASVHQRLLNKAKESNRPFNEILQYYTIERFIYRLSNSPHAEKFILKGALMFIVWNTSLSRPTKDIDLLGRINNSVEDIVTAVKDVCAQDVESDGISFNTDTISAMRITEDTDYKGMRVRVQGTLGTIRLFLQIDIGFGDVIVPKASKIVYPTILDFPAPKLKGYSMESTIAEKFQAMVKLGILNSRMKDFYDIWLLSKQFDYKGRMLSTAIQKTFENRKTEIPIESAIFKDSFNYDRMKEAQWKAFVKKTKLDNAPETFVEAIAAVKAFIIPIIAALVDGKIFQKTWIAPGPWL